MRTLYVDGPSGLAEAIASFRAGTITEAFDDENASVPAGSPEEVEAKILSILGTATEPLSPKKIVSQVLDDLDLSDERALGIAFGNLEDRGEIVVTDLPGEDGEPSGEMRVSLPSAPGGKKKRSRGRPATPPPLWSPATVPELDPDAIATLTAAFEGAGFVDPPPGPPKSQYLDPKKCLVAVTDSIGAGRTKDPLKGYDADLEAKRLPRVPGNAPSAKHLSYEATAQGLTPGKKVPALKIRMKNQVHLAIILYLAEDDRAMGVAWADAKVVGNRAPTDTMKDDELGSYLARYQMTTDASRARNKFEQWALAAYEMLVKRNFDAIMDAAEDDEELAQDIVIGGMKHARSYKPGTDFVQWLLAQAGKDDPDFEAALEYEEKPDAPAAPKTIPPGNETAFRAYMAEFGDAAIKGIRQSIKGKMGRNAVSPEDLDDLVQDTLLKAAQQIHTYDPSKAEFLTWIRRVAGSVLIDVWRSAGSRRERERLMAHSADEVDYEVDESLEAGMSKITFLEMVEALLEADLPFAAQRGRGPRPYRGDPFGVSDAAALGAADEPADLPTLTAKPGFFAQLKQMPFVQAALRGAQAPSLKGALDVGTDIGLRQSFQAGYDELGPELKRAQIPPVLSSELQAQIETADTGVDRATRNYTKARDQLRSAFSAIKGLDPETMTYDWDQVKDDADKEAVFNAFSDMAIDASLPMIPGFTRVVSFLEQVMIGVEAVALDTLGIGAKEMRTAEAGLAEAQDGARQVYEAAQQIIQRPVEFSRWEDFKQAAQAVIEAIRVMFTGTERAIRALKQVIDKSRRILATDSTPGRVPRFATVGEE